MAFACVEERPLEAEQMLGSTLAQEVLGRPGNYGGGQNVALLA